MPIGVDSVANCPKNLPIRPVPQLPGWRQVRGHERSNRDGKVFAHVPAAGETVRLGMASATKTVDNGLTTLNACGRTADLQLRNGRAATMRARQPRDRESYQPRRDYRRQACEARGSPTQRGAFQPPGAERKPDQRCASSHHDRDTSEIGHANSMALNRDAAEAAQFRSSRVLCADVVTRV